MTRTAIPTVLVVEDSDDDFYAFERACSRSPVPIALVRARDGFEARKYLGSADHASSKWPVLVFLDLNMPGIDGRALLQEIKAEGSDAKRLRVVVYTTSDSPTDVEFCYSNYANAFHTKPRDFREMRADLNEILAYWLTKADEPPGDLP